MMPEFAERAFAIVKKNGSVDLALCVKRTLSLLQKFPGFEPINKMFCIQKLLANSAMISGVSTTALL